MPAPRALITRAGAASALNYISDRSAHLLAGAFVVYGLVFAGWFAFHMPPFQNADEAAHFLRATQIGEGQLIGIRFDHDKSGGPVDRGILAAVIPFIPMLFHPEVKVDPGLYAADPGWTGEHVWLVGTDLSPCQFDSSQADAHQGAKLQQLEPDRAARRLCKLRVREPDVTQGTEKHIGHGCEPQAELVGAHRSR
jgi:hypothetical protein